MPSLRLALSPAFLVALLAACPGPALPPSAWDTGAIDAATPDAPSPDHRAVDRIAVDAATTDHQTVDRAPATDAALPVDAASMSDTASPADAAVLADHPTVLDATAGSDLARGEDASAPRDAYVAADASPVDAATTVDARAPDTASGEDARVSDAASSVDAPAPDAATGEDAPARLDAGTAVVDATAALDRGAEPDAAIAADAGARDAWSCPDEDGDGHPGPACGGDDCDDSAATGAGCHVGCVVYYLDTDLDGLGDPATGVPACAPLPGQVSNGSDCDDDRPLCGSDCTDADGDHACAPVDCDDSLATGASCAQGCSSFYRDSDGDGFGDPSVMAVACVAPAGHVANSADCDDGRALCTTDCTNLDGDAACAPFDCDDSAATGASCQSTCATFHRDQDGDGFGDPAVSALACVAPAGHVSNARDCNDSSSAIYPDAPEICDGVADDDCDGLADPSDPDCATAVEICDNLDDDDGNGQVDCADASCADDPGCLGNRCTHPIVLTQSGSVVVDTRSFTDDFTTGCLANSDRDVVFELTLTATSDLHLDTEGSDHDTALALRDAPCASGAEQACNDDVNPARDWARIERSRFPAGTYYIVVDAAAGSGGGQLTLHVEVVETPVDTRMPVAADPLVHMPGTQPGQGVTVEAPGRCLNCHENYLPDSRFEPADGWQGSMMAHAARDPLFFAALTVAAQDSIWALGRPNATDLCVRCHFPQGWVENRSDPTNASRMSGADWDGVSCDVCHQLWNPFFEDTHLGSREGSDWSGYWDEQNVTTPGSSAAAQATYDADRLLANEIPLFFGGLFFATDHRPRSPLYVENGGGQYFVSPGGQKRASFADVDATHTTLYSRFHKSRYMCSSCHDVSNPALLNLGHVPGDPLLPSEALPASAYFHIERTFSEFMLSAFGAQGGAPGTGAYAPTRFETSRPGNAIATCQDCHMADVEGPACDKKGRLSRRSQSLEHPESGLAMHDLTGGNLWVPWLLASTVQGSPNYDAGNAALLNGRAAALTLDPTLGLGIDAPHLLDGVARARQNLQSAASIDGLSYDAASGELRFRVTNHTGHKLISGFPEGRRMFVNVQLLDAGGGLVYEVNPYDTDAATLRGLDPAHAPSSPPLGPRERHEDSLVYEVQSSSTLTGEAHTFHIVLADGRYKDNRIPPRGFDVTGAAARLVQPVWHGVDAPNHFTAAEYAGGHDEVRLSLPAGAARAVVTLYYQTTSREYVEFLRDQIQGTGTSLPSPTLAGNAVAYVAQTDPFFAGLRAWGSTLWELWWRNRHVDGAAPVVMAAAATP